MNTEKKTPFNRENPMSNRLCIYHKNCADGLGAALAVYNSKEWGKDTEFLSAQYGDAESLLVIDHHKTAEEALKGLDFCIFDMNYSGAMLTWDYLHKPLNVEKVPELIRYIQDRDLWKWEMEQSREVSAALASYPMELEIWDRFLDDSEVEQLKLEGEGILRYQQTQIDRAIYQWNNSEQYIHLEDGAGSSYTVPVLNTSTLISEICGELAKGWPFAAVYFDTTDGKRVYSLRTRDSDTDVSAIAKHNGGGGHPAAAGFSVPIDQALAMSFPSTEGNRMRDMT